MKTIVVIGGAGSLGTEVTKKFLDLGYKVRVYSRDEYKHWQLKNKIGANPNIRYMLGDIRDRERLTRALEGAWGVIHCSALKQIESGEYNPQEVVKTNVVGTQNVIDACLDNDVKVACLVSSDKAVNPTNLYGASKYMSEKMWISSNNLKGSRDIQFFAVRFGNLRGSAGSVWELFEKQKEVGEFTITDVGMTRFDYTLEQASEFIATRMNISISPTIYIPKMSWYSIMDIPKLYHDNPKIKIIGRRCEEKLFEELCSEYEPIAEYDSHYVMEGTKYGVSIRSGVDLEEKVVPMIDTNV